MLTGYTFCIPIKIQKGFRCSKQRMLTMFYAKFGGSKKILSDNGMEFKNQLFEKVAKELGVEFKCLYSSISPTIKWENRRIPSFPKSMYVKTYFPKTMEWDEVVHFATAAYNFFPNEHSRESPFFLMFGRDPRIPLNTLLQPKIRYMGNR